MREHFEAIKQQVSIEQVANALGLKRQGRDWYCYPNERTASIKLYPSSNSFNDYGRNVGGDLIKLWSHIKNVNNWQACQEITAAFNLNVPNTVANSQEIQQAERQRQLQLQRQQLEQEHWRADVDRLKVEVEMYEQLLHSPHCEPLSDLWCTCKNRLTALNGQLDFLCGIN